VIRGKSINFLRPVSLIIQAKKTLQSKHQFAARIGGKKK
jgi:hypothetical protein